MKLLDIVCPSEHETCADEDAGAGLHGDWVVVAIDADAAFAVDLDGDE